MNGEITNFEHINSSVVGSIDLLDRKVPYKKCPFCSSFFLDNGQCEACGRVLRKHFLGLPFGESSYSVLKGEFWHNQHLLFKIAPAPFFLTKSSKRIYRQQLLRRLLNLYQYFLLDDVELIKSLDRKIFYEELKDVVHELGFFGQSEASLVERIGIVAQKLSDKSMPLITGEEVILIELITAIYRKNQFPISFWRDVWPTHLGGFLSLRFILPLIMLIIFFSCIAIVIFKELI